ncbi:OmpA family protein [Salinisphaera sp. USBA-960]|nr:OmpA family protein [Salifodinibacter halophilus]NNC26657.1 OmpA family protein [Salifodinibacter halophilus]
MRLLLSLLLVATLAGCAAFNNHYATIDSNTSGVAAANEALKAQVKTSVGDSGPTFEPLERAKAAVAKAEDARTDKLGQAKQALDKARSGWQELDDPADASAGQLAVIADNAHRAERLAQIGRYRATSARNQTRLKQLVGNAGNTRPNGEATVLVPGRFGVIKFQNGSARVTSDSHEVIDSVAKALTKPGMKNRRIGIAGHTAVISPSQAEVSSFIKANPRVAKKTSNASQERAAYKQALAVTRARDVAKLLVRAGVSSERVGLGVDRKSQTGAQKAVSIELVPKNDGS